MCRCFFITITFLSFLLLFIITLNKKQVLVNNSSIELNVINTEKLLKQISLSEIVRRNSNSETGFRKRIHIPKFMLDLYEAGKHDEYSSNLSKPDVVRSVLPKNTGTLQNNVFQSYEESHLLIFDIPPLRSDEKFVAAELRLLTLINININLVMGVERYFKISVYNETHKLNFVEERHVYYKENTWMKFNMTKFVQQLLSKKNYEHHVLKVVISVMSFMPFLNYDANNFKLSLLPVSEDVEHDYPILILSYKTLKKINVYHKNKITKRSIDEDYEEETNSIWDNQQQNKAQIKKLRRLKNTCKRKQLYVDFAEIQYDSWIVQPSGYEAYQCLGKCFYPVAEHLSPTKHAIVQALLHSVSPSKVPRSCCVPTRLDSISLLYVDEKGVLTYRYGYDDMVVLECGCR